MIYQINLSVKYTFYNDSHIDGLEREDFPTTEIEVDFVT